MAPFFDFALRKASNKSFFLFSYERFSLRRNANELVSVPTVAMRNGDFSGLINSQGILQQLYDPDSNQGPNYQRTPFSNNQVPISRISPLAKTLYAATPLPQPPTTRWSIPTSTP